MAFVLPEYTITMAVYEGAETSVHRGRRDSDGAPVAVKLLCNDRPTARQLGRLRREYEILRHLADVPGVPRAFALAPCDNGLALVLEDLGETSLHQALGAGRLDVATALDITASLASTLDAVHHRGVIHKDVKPHNVMVAPGPSAPRLIDFGISARLAQEISAAVSPTALEGTVAYMSPEQTGRMNRPLDRRSDLYSLGVTLYEMLTGALPFTGAEPADIVHGHLALTPIPPHELAPSVPRGLSDLVLRLLAKAPEDRYQTARGLRRDLDECLARWRESGQIEPFPLGRGDIPDELLIPQKLFGRGAEISVLLTAFERAGRGAAEMVMVAGYSGVGKSALVGELQKPIAQRNGFFASGKFDQVDRSVPLAPMAQAFRALVRQILAEPEGVRATFRTRLQEAVGQNGRLLLDLIPELAALLGPQPAVAVLPSTESKNRFGLLVQRFIRVFAAKAHPLVLFLDDLQWADPASLEMLGVLFADPESKHLLVVGAYRDNEVDAAHPLLATLAAIQKATPIATLELGPIDLRATTALVAEALRGSPEDVAELAALVFEKTQGNPFFVGQFLRLLHEQGMLGFDAQRSAFTWDLERIREAGVTDNVLDLMLGKLARLPADTQHVLERAACIGHSFDLGTLATVAEIPPARAAADLWEALREGLVVPIDGDYRLLDASEAFASAEEGQRISYRFLHDRVREAAYARIADSTRQALHLSIGRLLWARSGQSPRDEDLFEILRHLNQGIAQIEDPAEREEIAALDLRAGRRAKASTAYAAAAGYLDAGVEALGEGGWQTNHELLFALASEGAECAYLSGQTEPADARFDALLPRAKTDLSRARILGLRQQLYATRGKFSGAAEAGLAALGLLGIRFPATAEEAQAAFGAGLAKVAESLAGRDIDALIDLPDMQDPAHRLALQLLSDLTVPIYFVNPALYPAIVFEMAHLSLTHGNSDVSGFAYMAYGYFSAVFLGQIETGYAFGRMGLRVNEKQHGSYACKIYVLFHGMSYLREPARALLSYAEKVHQTGLECGDFVSVSTVSYYAPIAKLFLGLPLAEVREDLDKGFALTRRTQDQVAVGTLTVLRRVIANLRGQTSGRGSLNGEDFDEAAFRAGLNEKDESQTVFFFHEVRLFVRLIHGDHAGAAEDAEAAEARVAVVTGSFNATMLSPLVCLALLGLPAEADPDKAARRAARIAEHKAKIAALAAACPMNYQQWQLLIEAEEARLAGAHAAGIELCDRVIELAQKSEVLSADWMANELAAKLYLAVGKPKLARPYMTDAYLGYLRWGATAKAEDLARDHAGLLPQGGEIRRTTRATATATKTGMTTTLFGSGIGSIREAALVVRAAQAIASDLALPKVIERLMKLVLDNAGAQRGALLLARGDRLSIEARFEAVPEKIEVGLGIALTGSEALAMSVVHFVARTREEVIIDDAQEDRRFANDPRLLAKRARSVLCLPLVQQARLIGLLYLEHAEEVAAFGVARAELLELFAAQAAIAIENALLLADVQQANEEVRRSNDRLESEVAQRTEELRRMNDELGNANARLSLELYQREETEREREALQEQIIAAQRARLIELSTPLIPITDKIVVLPLIGSVDSERAAQLMDVALDGAARYQASVVILDITGMKHVDTHVVHSLMSTATALKLLGAQAVLTGIRAEVARTMIGLGVDMTGLVTKSTLKSGIAHALERSGEAGALAGKARAALHSR